MRVLGFDPGAVRQGWAVLEGDGTDDPRYFGSGVCGLERGDNEEYQRYRLRVISFWATKAEELLRRFEPDIVVNEIIPVKGGGQFVSAAQSQLAASAITSVQSIAYLKGYTVAQIGSTTVKTHIGGSNKATKVRVRNGIWEIMPSLVYKKNEWKTIFDESDAVAITLCYLGYTKPTDTIRK